MATAHTLVVLGSRDGSPKNWCSLSVYRVGPVRHEYSTCVLFPLYQSKYTDQSHMTWK